MSEIQAGQTAEFTRTVTEADVVLFAGVTGDLNPAHIDDVWARAGRFGGRIAHGMLSASFISTVLGMKLPGPGTIYLSQSLRFTAPVMIGETVTARVEVAEVLPKRRIRLTTTVVKADGTTIIEGEAMVLAPR
ncbi:MaoC family dehydratase [Longimicrobium sp.]|uniref:MaoC family dehydratase n=1 Tax=Longimicrobium sp. TaxID=2029185 RepID=UPI002E2FA5AD|nr:MaoC family dehydratase [Longimicrobium sp.]HEX6042522.1 MaoC family dehydratase [Longimicrobium sp.]